MNHKLNLQNILHETLHLYDTLLATGTFSTCVQDDHTRNGVLMGISETNLILAEMLPAQKKPGLVEVQSLTPINLLTITCDDNTRQVKVTHIDDVTAAREYQLCPADQEKVWQDFRISVRKTSSPCMVLLPYLWENDVYRHGNDALVWTCMSPDERNIMKRNPCSSLYTGPASGDIDPALDNYMATTPNLITISTSLESINEVSNEVKETPDDTELESVTNDAIALFDAASMDQYTYKDDHTNNAVSNAFIMKCFGLYKYSMESLDSLNLVSLDTTRYLTKSCSMPCLLYRKKGRDSNLHRRIFQTQSLNELSWSKTTFGFELDMDVQSINTETSYTLATMTGKSGFSDIEDMDTRLAFDAVSLLTVASFQSSTESVQAADSIQLSIESVQPVTRRSATRRPGRLRRFGNVLTSCFRKSETED